jgi:hypothetical protein
MAEKLEYDNYDSYQIIEKTLLAIKNTHDLYNIKDELQAILKNVMLSQLKDNVAREISEKAGVLIDMKIIKRINKAFEHITDKHKQYLQLFLKVADYIGIGDDGDTLQINFYVIIKEKEIIFATAYLSDEVNIKIGKYYDDYTDLQDTQSTDLQDTQQHLLTTLINIVDDVLNAVNHEADQ